MRLSVVRTVIFKNKVGDYKKRIGRDPHLRIKRDRVTVQSFDGQPSLVVIEVEVPPNHVSMMEGWNRGFRSRIGLG